MDLRPTNPDRLAFFKGLAKLWVERMPAGSMTWLEYLRGIAARASDMPDLPGPSAAGLDAFRRLVMARPNDMRHRLLGANVQRLQRLPRHQRRALRCLEVSPDLLSPLDELRYEPTHSRLLAYHMDPARGSPLALPLLRSFLQIAGCPPEVLEDAELGAADVTAEAWTPKGRVDIRIETTSLLAFVEVKVDASEGDQQLDRYRNALDSLKGQRHAELCYLTLPDASAASSTAAHTHMSVAAVWTVWLSIAAVDGEEGGYLARYLKSLALLLGLAGQGEFARWSFATQRAALDAVSHVETEYLS